MFDYLLYLNYFSIHHTTALIGSTSWFGLNDRQENDNYVFSDGKKLVIQNWREGKANI